MKLPRRNFLHSLVGAAFSPVISRSAGAQAYPSRFVRLIVPFPPGGSADPIARVLGNELSEIWGQQVVIENKGGAGGNVGAQAAVTAPADGYSIFFGGAFMGDDGRVDAAAEGQRHGNIGVESEAHGFGDELAQ